MEELQKSVATAAKLTSGRRESKEMAANIAELTREMAGLRARLDVLEARQIPYTAEELALITKPDATTLVAASVHHSVTAKSNRELSPKAVRPAGGSGSNTGLPTIWKRRNKNILKCWKLDSKDATFLADLASIQSDHAPLHGRRGEKPQSGDGG